LYLIGLLWAFAGVGEVTDTFMCAIETITAKERVHNDNNGEQHIVKVWNPTVANLTLMALGSSAPEILLGIIEICFSTEFYAGDLGALLRVGWVDG
jgi:solute carrier family 8 (sodium/calcium exchanger)